MNKCQAILKAYEPGDHIFLKSIGTSGLSGKINKIEDCCLEMIAEDGRLYRFNSLYIIYICEAP